MSNIAGLQRGVQARGQRGGRALQVLPLGRRGHVQAVGCFLGGGCQACAQIGQRQRGKTLHQHGMAVCTQRQRLQIAAAQHAAKRLIRRAFIQVNQQIYGIGRKSVVYASQRIGWKSQQKGVFQAKML